MCPINQLKTKIIIRKKWLILNLTLVKSQNQRTKFNRIKTINFDSLGYEVIQVSNITSH